MPTQIARLRANAARWRQAAAEVLARARAEAQELVSRAEAADRAADALEKLSLRGRNDSASLRRVNTIVSGGDPAPAPAADPTAPTKPARRRKRGGRRGAPLRSTAPAAAAARDLGISVSDLAVLIGENYASLRTWDRRGNHRVARDGQPGVLEKIASVAAAGPAAAKAALASKKSG